MAAAARRVAAVALVLDGGPCPVGVESTVVDLGEPRVARLLRPGGLSRERLEALVGPLESEDKSDSRPRAPGQLVSHYAPLLPVRLDATEVASDEALLAFGPEPPTGALAPLHPSPAAALADAARNRSPRPRALAP